MNRRLVGLTIAALALLALRPAGARAQYSYGYGPSAPTPVPAPTPYVNEYGYPAVHITPLLGGYAVGSDVGARVVAPYAQPPFQAFGPSNGLNGVTTRPAAPTVAPAPARPVVVQAQPVQVNPQRRGLVRRLFPRR
jgi:hypothetical protein